MISTTTDQQLQRKWRPPETHVCLDLELCIKAKLFSAGGCLKLNDRNQRFFCHLPCKSDITECYHIYVENKQSKQFSHPSIHLPTHPTNPTIHPPIQFLHPPIPPINPPTLPFTHPSSVHNGSSDTTAVSSQLHIILQIPKKIAIPQSKILTLSKPCKIHKIMSSREKCQ